MVMQFISGISNNNVDEEQLVNQTTNENEHRCFRLTAKKFLEEEDVKLIKKPSDFDEKERPIDSIDIKKFKKRDPSLLSNHQQGEQSSHRAKSIYELPQPKPSTLKLSDKGNLVKKDQN